MNKLNIYIPVYPVKVFHLGHVVEIITPADIPFPKMNLVDDVNKLYISALKPNAKQAMVRVSGLAEFAGWKVKIFLLIISKQPLHSLLYRILVF